MEGTTKGTPTARVVLRAPSPHLGHLQGWGAATSLGHCAHFINYNSLAKVKSSLQHVERQALGRTLLNENLYNIVMLSHAEEEASPAWSVCSGQDGVSREDRHTVTGDGACSHQEQQAGSGHTACLLAVLSRALLPSAPVAKKIILGALPSCPYTLQCVCDNSLCQCCSTTSALTFFSSSNERAWLIDVSQGFTFRRSFQVAADRGCQEQCWCRDALCAAGWALVCMPLGNPQLRFVLSLFCLPPPFSASFCTLSRQHQTIPFCLSPCPMTSTCLSFLFAHHRSEEESWSQRGRWKSSSAGRTW